MNLSTPSAYNWEVLEIEYAIEVRIENGEGGTVEFLRRRLAVLNGNRKVH